MLYGRDAERSVIGRLLEDAGAGASGVLVVRGEPGIGKTALLDSFADQDDMLVLRGVGIESEAELPFGGLHLLLRPVLADQLKGLPDPQRQALEGAFGLALGVSADRMMVGLAVLTLLSELAEDAPVLCLIDDAQWLDRPSAEALLFAARRLGAEGVAMVFAVRDGEAPFPTPGLPELRLTGLSCEAAAALVDAREGDLASEVRRRVLAEAGGNPLALIELPTALTVSTPGPALPLTNRLQLAFHAQAGGLPEASRTLLLVAAADDTGDLGLLLRAAESMGAGVGDLPAVEEAGLLRLDGRQVTFRHPLVRAAVYQGTPLDQRLCAHRALAGALTDADQADRRAWHLASAATGPDAAIAAELERTASLAAERKGYAASAAAYERAAQLAATAEVRTRLLTLAAETALESGALARAQALAERVTDPVARRGLVRVRATAAAGQGFLRQAHALQLAEATRLAERDPVGAVEVMMDALHTTWFSGEHDLATVTATQLEALRPPAGDPTRSVLRLQRWLTALALGRSAERLPDLAEVFAQAAAARAHEARDVLMICGIGLMGGLDTEAESLASGVVAAARTAGKVGVLPAALYYAAISQTFLGRHRDAATSAAEALDIAEDTGQPHWVGHAQGVLAHLSAIEGDETRCRDLARPALTDPGTGARPAGLHGVRWALGLLDLGHGRVREALDHLSTLYHGPARHQLPAERSLPDLVEAAVRLGELDLATGALDRLTDLARRVPVPSIEALLHRCRALLDPDDDAFALSLRLHQRDSRPFEHARTQLLYGEWLRRGRRKTEARAQLAAALETFDLIGARAWADRAQSELEATGVVATTPRRGPGVLSLLTPQELHIVTLAADGMSNKDIAAQLFISPRTVGHHLYRAYPKLGVASRHELSDALAAHQ
ncbi:AAA family ATPase [Streptomyces sp. TLI_105]|uniref:helix-turn-helix transcriptional regulator n=1 Tax=Streptomyces sp. TLI_105 TaxID=1881019 RepID=UPI0008949AD7|nr:AAA family ATPase [Streptomyces sp. TLI_105]SEE20689.1 regulatory protein, luxR family [Streptomyces sp. TLI_105]